MTRRGPAWVLPVVLFLAIDAAYLANGRTLGNIDTIPARYLPFSLIRHGSFDFGGFRFLFRGGVVPTVFREHEGRFVSIFPPVAGLFATPVYLIPVLRGLDPESPTVPRLEKLAASALTALAGVSLFLLLRRLGGPGLATGLTLVYALGTSAFSISSQALWQHGPSQLLLSLGLCLLVRRDERPERLRYAALALSGSVVARYPNVLLVAPIFWYMARRHPGSWRRWVPWAALPPLALALYNLRQLGSPLELSYGREFLDMASARWSAPMRYTLPALLFSPASGLFVYSPIFLFSLLGIALTWTAPGALLWRVLAVGCLLELLLVSRFHMWWSYWYYGPRLLADLAPVLALFLWPAWEAVRGRRLLAGAFVTAAVVSVVVQGIGAFGYDGTWYANPVTVSEDRIWSWRDPPFLHYGARLVDRLRGRPAGRIGDTGPPPARWDDGLGCDFGAVLARPLVPFADPPQVSIRSEKSAYRLDEIGRFSVALANGNETRNFTLHVALRGPEGGLYFVFADRVTVPAPPCAVWMPLGVPVTFPPHFRVDEDLSLDLLLRGRPPGRYVWYALLTEPSTAKVVTRASRAFELLPGG